MKLERYAIVSDVDHTVYEFLSEGPRGIIRKVVVYERIRDNVFNLSFGDWDETEQKMNDGIRSNNHDRDKVLATVASTVIDFVEYHPGTVIQATGFTASGTRLYQMGIIANFDEISNLFEIEGLIGGAWCIFERGVNYAAFSLKAK